MKINISWDNSEKSALRYELCGSWTWSDFDAANLKAYGMLVSVEHPVSIILDLENCLELPANALVPLRKMLAYAPANLDLVVVSSSNESEERTVRMLTQFDSLLGSRLTLSHSLESAQRLVVDFHRANDVYTSRSYPA